MIALSDMSLGLQIRTACLELLTLGYKHAAASAACNDACAAARAGIDKMAESDKDLTLRAQAKGQLQELSSSQTDGANTVDN